MQRDVMCSPCVLTRGKRQRAVHGQGHALLLPEQVEALQAGAAPGGRRGPGHTGWRLIASKGQPGRRRSLRRSSQARTMRAPGCPSQARPDRYSGCPASALVLCVCAQAPSPDDLLLRQNFGDAEEDGTVAQGHLRQPCQRAAQLANPGRARHTGQVRPGTQAGPGKARKLHTLSLWTA